MIQLRHEMRVYCDAGFHSTPMEQTLSVGSMAEAKQQVKAAGWRVLPDGRIVCRECVAAGRKARG